MEQNDNAVNIEGAEGTKAPSRAYHHGDLREALIAQGMKLIEGPDGADLSLRAVARAVGVSAPSVYRHFPDKAALMTALAREGVARLGELQRKAARDAGGGSAGFAATGRVYVRFALDNPALFRLIYASPVLGGYADPQRHESEPAMLLQAHAAQMAGLKGRAVHIQALRSWALVHGLAMLMLDGQIPSDPAMVDAVLDNLGV